MTLAYGVHARHEGKVLAGVVLGREQEAVPLRRGYVDHIGAGRLRVHAVDLDDGDVVAFEPDVLGSKGTHVDHAEEVRLPRLHWHLEVPRVVEESIVGDGFGATRISLVDESGQEIGHLAMVPIRDGQDKLFVVLILEGVIWVVDNDRSPEAIGVLPPNMTMIPVGARLVDLSKVSSRRI